MSNFGKIDGHSTTEHTGAVIKQLYCTEAVTALNFLTLEVTDSAPGLGNRFEQTDGNQEMIVAIAAETTTAAGYARCYVKGVVDGANVTTGVAALEGLEGAAASAGRAVATATQTNSTKPVGAITLETAAANAAKVLLLDPLNLAD